MMSKDRYKRKILLLVFIIILAAWGVLHLYQYTKMKNNLNSNISYIGTIIRKDFNSNITKTQKEYSYRTDKVLKTEGIIEAFTSRDREKLFKLLNKSYQEQKSIDSFLKIVTFRLPDGSAFLRMHKPEMYGDALNKKRTIIMDVNREQKRLFGFEIGKLKMSYRVVTPIFHNSKYVGLVEIGISPKKFINNISDLFDVKNALVVKTKATEVSLDKKEYFSKNEFSLISDDKTIQEIFNLAFTEYADKRVFLFTDRDNGIDYMIGNDLDLLNQNNQVVARVLLAHNITEVIREYNRTLYETVLFVMILSIVVLLLLNFSFNLYIKKINESEELLKTIFDTTTESIGILDLESNFLLVNRAYENMTGFTKDELYATSCKALTTPDTLEATKDVVSKVLEKGSYLGFEKSCIVKDGRKIDVLMNTVLMPDKERMLVTMHDITLQNIEEKEKIVREQQMLQQSRLAQMGEMISMIAHQWRQPLSAISTTSVNLKLKIEMEAFDLSSKAGALECNNYFLERLDRIDDYVETLTTTIDDFRNFYKQDKKRVVTSFETVVSKSLSVIEASLLSDDIEIIKEYNSDKEIELYDSEVMQVVLNIIKNAQDNFKEREIENPYIKIIIEDKTLSICDNGGGVPKEILPKIFDPYFSTKDEKNGTGLGLYMSKTIIEDHHNGKLLANNIEGGICFKVELGADDD
ncbi:MAG: PAS domain S-box protein [Campylobacterota bacterium]